MDNFGDKLKRLRISLGLTQEELAEKAGVQKQTISRYENSDREPNLKTAKILADALGVTLEKLVEEPKATAPESGHEKEIMDLISRLEASPLPVRNAAIAAALAVLRSDLSHR